MSEYIPSETLQIIVSDLVKQYHHQNVLDHLSLTVQSGELCVLVGDNGSGKTTLLRVLASLSRPEQGEIRMEGIALSSGPQWRDEIGYVGHQTLFYQDLSALANLQHYAKLYLLPNPKDRALKAIQKMGLTKYQHKPVRTFSRGMQQRLTIARALLHDPAILLFDEPYTGLDGEAARILDETLRDLHQPGKIIIVADHHPLRMLPFASHIAWLQNGNISHHVPVETLADVPELDNYLRRMI
jgi:heme exporter protein A